MLIGIILAAGLIVVTVVFATLRGSASGKSRRRDDGAAFLYGSDASGSSDSHCPDGSSGDCGGGDGGGGGGD